jgi:hypothetical protein
MLAAPWRRSQVPRHSGPQHATTHHLSGGPPLLQHSLGRQRPLLVESLAPRRYGPADLAPTDLPPLRSPRATLQRRRPLHRVATPQRVEQPRADPMGTTELGHVERRRIRFHNRPWQAPRHTAFDHAPPRLWASPQPRGMPRDMRERCGEGAQGQRVTRIRARCSILRRAGDPSDDDSSVVSPT